MSACSSAKPPVAKQTVTKQTPAKRTVTRVTKRAVTKRAVTRRPKAAAAQTTTASAVAEAVGTKTGAKAGTKTASKTGTQSKVGACSKKSVSACLAADDTVPLEVVAAPRARASRTRGPGGRKRSAVDRLDDPPPASGLELIVRVSRAIEHELMQIERIVGGRHVPVAQRSEAERRARTLASLARTLNEVKRLRAGEEKPKADDDDAVPRDLDEFRRELSRRLALMDAGAAPPAAGGDE